MTRLDPSLTSLAIVLMLSGAASAHDEGHRQMGAHVHGVGTVDIAVEGQRVSLAVALPGMDSLGFEHAAATDAEKAQVADVTKRLGDVASVATFPAAAQCIVTDADVEVEGLEDEHGHEHGHDKDHAATHAEHVKDGTAAEHGHDEAHSEVHAEYALTCASPSALSGVTIVLFDTFPTLETLTVQAIGPAGSKGATLTRDARTLAF